MVSTKKLSAPIISIIVTAYNDEQYLQRAVLSVLESAGKSQFKDFELLIIDDCSSDNSYEIACDFAKKDNRIKAWQLTQNSGSPSSPRNFGIEKATGEYVTFLDSDDTVDCSVLAKMVGYAKEKNLQVIKGYLKIIKVKHAQDANKLIKVNDIRRDIITQQSTSVDIIILREFLIKNQIRFNKDIKIGEDTLFYAELFGWEPSVEYLDMAFYYYHKEVDRSHLASTQHYQDKELLNHLFVWSEAEKLLNKTGLSYYEVRLTTAIRVTIGSLILLNNSISQNVFSKLQNFVRENQKYINEESFADRYREVYSAILRGSYQEFQEVTKRRLLIAGYDLKFITNIIPFLENDFNVKIDEWTGHNMHNESQSKELLAWADVIFCEWLLGNAVWYSKHKYRHQLLLVRCHRFEADREFGFEVDIAAIDAFVCVGFYHLNLFKNKFILPSEKMFLVGNYINPTISTSKTTWGGKYFNLAMVGIIPKHKGFMKALRLIKRLSDVDSMFKLHVFGQNPFKVNWVSRDPVENQYYESCMQFIKDHKLDKHIEFHGWKDNSEIYKEIGWVLSLSDSESFHLAPAEGAAAGAVPLVLRSWPGCEYIYPPKLLHKSLKDIERVILDNQGSNTSMVKDFEQSRAFILESYSVERFVANFNELVTRISLLAS